LAYTGIKGTDMVSEVAAIQFRDAPEHFKSRHDRLRGVGATRDFVSLTLTGNTCALPQDLLEQLPRPPEETAAEKEARLQEEQAKAEAEKALAEEQKRQQEEATAELVEQIKQVKDKMAPLKTQLEALDKDLSKLYSSRRARRATEAIDPPPVINGRYNG